MIDVLLWIVLVVSLITDLRERRILNIVTLPAIAVGLVFHLFTDGWSGLLFSGGGFLVGGLLLFIPFALGGVGGGDVKLLAAIGALKGTGFVFSTFLFTCLAGGLIALSLLIKNRQLKMSLQRIGGATALKTLDTLDKGDIHHAFPYGVAIFIGTLCAYVWGRM
ncbi:A24 family peptidase [Desertibacillus haloalkaliphilus]|uniref:A24 family peptidase n=1 Tax=Desertibacillus haloalkaliphilus TaxID=1328930 RepID=UPI001C27537B|nr:prepilin peptidase [Desertibacillus haloalkaliphilus]MBU8908042.1 prepilin peptidase [Desertibacillus haloalkaliphilus]